MIKKAAAKFANYPVMAYCLRKQKRGPVALFYHGVEEQVVDSRIQSIHISLADFEKHIQHLKEHFEVITLDYLFECISNGYKIEPFQVLITFDDGYKNNLYIAAPLLHTYDLPFTVFVSTKHVDEGVRFPTYYLRACIFFRIVKH